MKQSLLALLFCFSHNLFASLEHGIVARYYFNDATSREEINGLHAKGIGISYTSDRFGNHRASCYLQGNESSYLNLGTSPLLKPRAGSISLWVNIDMTMFGGRGVPANPIILTKNDTTADFFEGYALYYNYLVKKVVAATNLSQDRPLTIHSSDTLSRNSWHHLVLTYDDNFTCLYIDGLLDTKMHKGFTSRFNPADSVMVGNTANKRNHRFLCGSVDDIFIYDRVLTASEVEELYEAPDPKALNKTYIWLYRALAVLLVLFIVMLLVMRWYRRDLERQKEKNRITARLNELETKAIRTQMNPHFIFNSLNTIQSFMLEGDITSSNLYLTKFALLLRKLIESSTSDSISLDEEIDILERYVEIEKLRFENAFEYKIVTDITNPSNIFVPFMLVQPFVENAIWHGLLPKKSDCFLSVRFTELDENRLMCTVDDNGVGRQAKLRNHPLKKRSLAIEFIRQRLEILQKSTNITCGFSIHDKKDTEGKSLGTRVEIIIPKLRKNDARHSDR